MIKINFNNLKKTFITAEIGINHNGDEKRALKMILIAAKSGVDAVKLQTFMTDDYISVDSKERYERTKKFELNRNFFNEIFSFAKKNKIVLYTTPFSIDDLEFIKNKTPIIKIASGELTYHELIYKSALTRKPIILSTGLAKTNEIEKAIKIVYKANPKARKDGKLLLNHCIAAYPTPLNESNLNSIKFLNDKFSLPIGFSDHTIENETSIYAVLAGAAAIEKHFTLNSKDKYTRDHAISFEPIKFKLLVKKIREIEIVLGNKNKNIQKSEKENYKYLRRSAAAITDLSAKTRIKKSHITGIRPLTGIPIEEINRIIGKKLRKNLKKGQIIKKSNLE